MAVDAFTRGRHWDCLRAIDVFATPPTSQGLLVFQIEQLFDDVVHHAEQFSQ